MTPSEYASMVVAPTVREYLAAMGDQRRAYLACIAVYHLTDYVAKAEGTGDRAASDVRAKLRGACENSFDVVQGICNGSKHCGTKPGVRHAFSPGEESTVPPSAYGMSGGYGHGRYGGLPGLMVEHNGHRMLVDVCVTAVLETFERLFPQHFSAMKVPTPEA
jgi:hypothetical protein